MNELIQQWLALPGADLVWLAVGSGCRQIRGALPLPWIVSERAAAAIFAGFWYLSSRNDFCTCSLAIQSRRPCSCLGQTPRQ